MRKPLLWNEKIKLAIISPPEEDVKWRKLEVATRYAETGLFRFTPDLNYFKSSAECKGISHEDIYSLANMLIEISQADMVLFLDEWENDLLCNFAHSICKARGIITLTEKEGEARWLGL